MLLAKDVSEILRMYTKFYRTLLFFHSNTLQDVFCHQLLTNVEISQQLKHPIKQCSCKSPSITFTDPSNLHSIPFHETLNQPIHFVFHTVLLFVESRTQSRTYVRIKIEEKYINIFRSSIRQEDTHEKRQIVKKNLW